MYDDHASHAFRLYSTIVEHALDAIVVLDAGGGVLLANRAARALADVDLRQLLSRSTPARPELAAFFAQIDAGLHARAEIAVRDASGAERRLLLDGRADHERAVVTLRDVTATRRAEAELARLRRAEGLAQRAAATAHDLNNLLAIIATAAGQLARRDGSGAIAVTAEDVKGAAERAARLARRIGQLSRGEPDGPRAINLGAAIRELRPLVERALGDGIELDLALDEDAPPACVDPEELGHVLVNLAMNARDAMPNGGRVTIGAAGVALEGPCPSGHVLLTFSDDGEGMPASVRERALDDFFTTKGSRGSGLGLANAREFARRSGGRISIRSAPGQGTTIAMVLPRAPSCHADALGRRDGSPRQT